MHLLFQENYFYIFHWNTFSWIFV